MPQLVLALLKINLVLLLFAGVYYLLLRKLTFYRLNRFFLVFGIAFSSVYPFVNLSSLFQRQQTIPHHVAELVPQVGDMVPAAFELNAWQWVLVVFYAGAAVMAIRLSLQLFSLYRIHRRSLPGNLYNQPVRLLRDELSPFSFWQTIYINPQLHKSRELETIIDHEKVHVREWHTADILLAELSLVCYWFNPGIWLMKKAVKENIEFLTDAKLLRRGLDRKTYQYSLLEAGNLQAVVPLVNHFNLSDLKKRIRMMNARRSSPFKLSVYIVALPMLLLLSLAFTIHAKKQKQVASDPVTVAVQQPRALSVPAALPEKRRQAFRRAAASAAVKHLQRKDTVRKSFFSKSIFIITRDSLGNTDLQQAAAANAAALISSISFDNSSRVLVLTDSLKQRKEKISDVRITYLRKELPEQETGAKGAGKKRLVTTMVYHYTDSAANLNSGHMLSSNPDAGLKLTGGISPDQIKSIQVQQAGNGQRKVQIQLKEK
ncbi:hypothetical protein C7T94_07375 [Pedobacter yulinensis]|uniref:Peptidase M56 domain-containing protein n=1 Tax=Pedobacter yulinensis TaxID=2126353 RepID=A0A2T3HJ79_9SPHI|nr:M56 family metallopeptidase [Pedobacter yulinensis]PST82490.1 hypothetical protein C7T94_07375 [Pedobacter yulinensis]